MKKIAEELRTKNLQEILKEEKKLREDMAKTSLDFRVNLPKDTNLIYKKKKRLAVLLTIANQKREEELLKKDVTQVSSKKTIGHKTK